jgi:hypothetical protein
MFCSLESRPALRRPAYSRQHSKPQALRVGGNDDGGMPRDGTAAAQGYATRIQFQP